MICLSPVPILNPNFWMIFEFEYLLVLKLIAQMKNAPFQERIHLVPRAGIEPARCFQRGILSPVRLPIPPSRRHDRYYRRFAAFEQHRV